MNNIFNSICSAAKMRWVVAKSFFPGIAILSAILGVWRLAYALDPAELPVGGQITVGTGDITSSTRQMTVNQTSQQMIANWSSFNIGSAAGVQFVQPNTSATALNRINDQNPTQIFGLLSSNGNVFLVNQSGIVFGNTATVNVGGLVASTMNILDNDFLAGRYTFTNSGGAGSILNQGDITIRQGGIVALIAPKVTNDNTINNPGKSSPAATFPVPVPANSSSIALAEGSKVVSIDFTGDGLITFSVDQAAVDALLRNSGIVALEQNNGFVNSDQRLVAMTDKAASILVQTVANNTDIIQARSLQQREGHLLLEAGGETSIPVPQAGSSTASSTTITRSVASEPVLSPGTGKGIHPHVGESEKSGSLQTGLSLSEREQPVIKNGIENQDHAIYQDSALLYKLLLAGGAVIIVGGGALLFAKNYHFSAKNSSGKNINIYSHVDYGTQYLDTAIIKSNMFAGRREVSICIMLDKGVQVAWQGLPLLNSDKEEV